MARFRKKFKIRLLGVLLSLLSLGWSTAQAFTLKDFEQWWQKYKEAKPEFKPGDVLTYEDREKLRPFLAPEALDFYLYPGVEIKVSETRDYTFHHLFIEATEKFGQQTKLSPEGELLDYLAGMPFPQGRIEKETDPVKQGICSSGIGNTAGFIRAYGPLTGQVILLRLVGRLIVAYPALD